MKPEPAKQLDFLGQRGTPGPWVTADGLLDREMLKIGANRIAGSRGGADAWSVAKAMSGCKSAGLELSSGSDRRVDRALQLLKKWGLIEHDCNRWHWIGGLPEEPREPLGQEGDDAP